jgi:hypothetical protein
MEKQGYVTEKRVLLRCTTRKLLIYIEKYKIVMFPAYKAAKKSGKAAQDSKRNSYHTPFRIGSVF